MTVTFVNIQTLNAATSLVSARTLAIYLAFCDSFLFVPRLFEMTGRSRATRQVH